MNTVNRISCLMLLLFAIGAQAPASAGTLAGRVVGPAGAPVAEAPVRAVSAATGADARAFSDADGRYELTGLPAGAFTITVAMPCCAFAPYENSSVVLANDQTQRLEIALAEGGSLNVLGDDPGTINAELRNRQNIPDLPVPRRDDGTLDLSGIWLISDDPFPEPASVLPWAQDVADERIATSFVEHPHTRCLPSEPATPGGSTPFIAKIIQTPELIVILFEDVPGYRQIFLDGRPHPEFPNPSWMGHSIGTWDGDTLVVDTVGFNGRVWVDAYPSTEMMHMEERFTRNEFGRMDVRLTIEDSGVFTEAWVRNLQFDLAPQEGLIEYVCENNKWAQ